MTSAYSPRTTIAASGGRAAAHTDNQQEERGGRRENGDVAAGDGDDVIRSCGLQRFSRLVGQPGAIANQDSRRDRGRSRTVRPDPSSDSASNVGADVGRELGDDSAALDDVDEQAALDRPEQDVTPPSAWSRSKSGTPSFRYLVGRRKVMGASRVRPARHASTRSSAADPLTLTARPPSTGRHWPRSHTATMSARKETNPSRRAASSKSTIRDGNGSCRPAGPIDSIRKSPNSWSSKWRMDG